VRYFGST